MAAQPMGRMRAAVAAVAALAVVQIGAVASGFTAWYQAPLLSAPHLRSLMASGVYRSRLLAWLVDLSVGRILRGAGLGPNAALFDAVRLVNLAAFGVTIWLLSQLLTGRRLVAVAMVLAACGYVITPYDFVSYLAIVAVAHVSVRVPDRSQLTICAVLILGVATRESVLLAVPMLLL